jgi:hypothetical protein
MSSGSPTIPSCRAIVFLGGTAMLGCAIWMCSPLDAVGTQNPEPPTRTPKAPRREPTPLDVTAFRAPLWVAPASPAQARAPEPPSPLRLQLIAIIREAGAFKAVLYDPDADTLTVVGAGDTIAGRTIERVGSAELTLRDGGRSRTLSLRIEREP